MKSYLKLILILITLYGVRASAQVGMNDNAPNKSAALDINASNKGLLIPNVKLLSLTDKASISGGNPKESLMVYNTNASLVYGAGYYYWDGSSWQKLIQTGSADNLGNHAATQNLQMGSNLISSNGATGQGLGFDSEGNGTFNQKLTVKSLATSSAVTDKTLTIGSDGVVKARTANISTSSTSLFKYTLASDALMSGSSGKIKFGNKMIDKSNLVASMVDNSGSYSVFKAPKTGFYFFSVSVYQFRENMYAGGTGFYNAKVNLRNESTTGILATSIANMYTNNPYYWGIQNLFATVKLNKDDKISVEFSNNFGGNTFIAGDRSHPQLSYFSGFFISE